MRRFVRSETYGRARLISGALFMLLGAAILVRTIAETGLQLKAMPAYVLGLAMVALGAFRFRDFLAARRIR